MRLSQLDEKSNIVLDITINGQNLEFKSVVATIINDIVLIEPIRVKGKVINFESANVIINLLLIRDNTAPIIWKRVLLKTITYKSKTYYKVISSAEGFEMNRRTTFRMYIGIAGVVQVGVNSTAVDVIVKDVSENGFSFVCKENIDKPMKTTVRLVFSDGNRTYSLSGLLVRRQEIDKTKFVYGCVLNIRNQLLNKYINQKQREMLSRQSDIISKKHHQTLQGFQARENRESIINEKLEQQKMKSDEDINKTINNTIKGVDKWERRNTFKY